MPRPVVPGLTRKVMTFGAGSLLVPAEVIDNVVPLMVPLPDWPTTSALASSDDRSHVVVYLLTSSGHWAVWWVSVRVKVLPGAICPPHRDGEVTTETDPRPSLMPSAFFQ